jgi:ABC-2 type transport system permease protein
MIHRMAALVTKEFIQIRRDPVLLIFALVGPMLQLVMLGNAISRDIVDIPVGIIDYDVSPLSREIIAALDNTSELQVVRYPQSMQEAEALIDSSEVMAVVVIPRLFMERTRSGTDVPQIQVVLDGGGSSFTAGSALRAAQGAVQSLANSTSLVAGSEPDGGIELSVEALYNRALDLRPHSITAQLAFITFQITTLVAVMGVVREREIGTIEMLTITPLRRLELIAGKAITPLIIGIIDFFVMFLVTQVVFAIPIRGSFILLLGLTVLYLICEIGFALMLSTITRSQQQAVTLVFVWSMVAITMSGYLVPISRLPRFMQWLTWFVPLRHYLSIVRTLMLKGGGIIEVLPSAAAILALTVMMIFVTTRTLSRVIE